jgi:hypothetical protein
MVLRAQYVFVVSNLYLCMHAHNKPFFLYALLGLTAWWWGAAALLVQAQISFVLWHGQWRTSPALIIYQPYSTI